MVTSKHPREPSDVWAWRHFDLIPEVIHQESFQKPGSRPNLRKIDNPTVTNVGAWEGNGRSNFAAL